MGHGFMGHGFDRASGAADHRHASSAIIRKVLSSVVLVAGCASAWAQSAGDAPFALGKKLFMQGAVPSCTVCHTLRDAGATGAVGPVLDELKPNAQRVATALRNGVGAMPSYAATLSEADIAALAHYVATASGAAK